MILTRLVKRLSSAFVCLSVWLKIIKLPFWQHVKAEQMAGVTLCMELDQNSIRGLTELIFIFIFFFHLEIIFLAISFKTHFYVSDAVLYIRSLIFVMFLFCTFLFQLSFDSHLCIRFVYFH